MYSTKRFLPSNNNSTQTAATSSGAVQRRCTSCVSQNEGKVTHTCTFHCKVHRTLHDCIEHKPRTRGLKHVPFGCPIHKEVAAHDPSLAVLLNVKFQRFLLSALLQIAEINFASATMLADVPRSKRRADTTNFDVFVKH